MVVRSSFLSCLLSLLLPAVRQCVQINKRLDTVGRGDAETQVLGGAHDSLLVDHVLYVKAGVVSFCLCIRSLLSLIHI